MSLKTLLGTEVGIGWRWVRSRVERLTAWMSAEGPVEAGRRGFWANDRQYLITLLGFSIGMSNILTFPTYVATYGGSFILIYVLLLALVGYPLVLLETSLGQFTSRGPVHIFRHMAPALEGVGWNVVYGVFASFSSYQALHAVVIFFLINSIQCPWYQCWSPKLFPEKNWNSEICLNVQSYQSCLHSQPDDHLYAKGGCYSNDDVYSRLLDRLQRCVLSPDAYSFGHKYPGCSFSIELDRENTHLDEFFAMPSADNTSCTGIFTESLCESVSSGEACPKDACSKCARGKGSIWLELSSSSTGKPRWLSGEKVTDAQERSRRFAQLLREARPDPALVQAHECWCSQRTRVHSHEPSKWSMLACLLHKHCQRLQPPLKPVPCLRRHVNFHERLSAYEMYEFHVGKPYNGHWHWRLSLHICLILVWLLVGLSTFRGGRSLGMIVVFSIMIIFPMTVVFAIVCLSLPGASEGLKLYLRPPTLCELGNVNLWLDALLHMVVSLGIQTGGLSTLSSFQPFTADVAFYSLLLIFADFAVSFVASLGIFSLLGHLADFLHTTPARLLQDAQGQLAFSILPQATSLPYPNFPNGCVFAVFFFLLLSLLALHTASIQLLIISTAIYDEWKRFANYRRLLLAIIGIIGFLLGVPFISTFGMALQTDYTDVKNNLALPVVCFGSILAVLIYFPHRALEDFQLMIVAAKEEEVLKDAAAKEKSQTVSIVNKTGWRDRFASFSLSRFMFSGPGRFYLYFCYHVTVPVAVTAYLVLGYYRYMVGKAAELSWLELSMALALGPVLCGLLLLGGLFRAVWWRGGRGLALLRPSRRWGPVLIRHRRLGDRFQDALTSTTQESDQGTPVRDRFATTTATRLTGNTSTRSTHGIPSRAPRSDTHSVNTSSRLNPKQK